MRRLPGDPSAERQIARMIRVDHAGEYGATRIYEGQLAVLGNSPAAKEIRRMADAGRPPPCRVRPAACSSAGCARPRCRRCGMSPGSRSGAATAMLGTRAAMACTVAVEEVIDEHYRGQIEALGDSEPALGGRSRSSATTRSSIATPRCAHGGEDGPGRCWVPPIKAGAKLAIWLSTRL